MAKLDSTGGASTSPVSVLTPVAKAEAVPAKDKLVRRFVVCRSGWLARHFGYVPTTTEDIIRRRGYDPDQCVAQGLLKLVK